MYGNIACCSVWFIRFVSFNHTQETDRRDQRNQTDEMNPIGFYKNQNGFS